MNFQFWIIFFGMGLFFFPVFRLFITRCSIKYRMCPSDAGTSVENCIGFSGVKVPKSFVSGIFFCWVSDGLPSGAELEQTHEKTTCYTFLQQ